jgi:signal transduction histidine kinase
MSLNFIDLFRKSFRFKLTLNIGLVFFVALFLYFVFFIQQLTRTLDEGLVEQGESSARDLGFAAELGVLAGDPTFVDASITGIVEKEAVAFGAVYTREGNLISKRGELYDNYFFSQEVRNELVSSKKVIQAEIAIGGKNYYEFFAPIVIRTTGVSGVGEVIGFTQVVVSLDGIREKQRHFMLLYFAVTFVIFLGAGSAVMYITRRITRSVDSLMHGVQNVTKGRFENRIVVGTKDEFGRLGDAFNEMTDRLQEVKDRDEGVSRMKSEFLSITAHQLRTPLSALKWVLHMSLEGDMGKLTKKQQGLLEKGYDANERMITLVNDLLDVVRIEEGRFDYKFHKVDFVELVEEMVGDMKLIADQKKVTLEFHKPSRVIPKISVDSEKLRLVFMNIVDNALQYTHAKGRVEVAITYKDNILVTVKDTGVGIPKNQMIRIFSKFFRADNAVRMQTAGSGLGLFIAKNIIEKHGGKIWIDSEEGKGTSVNFTLPISHLKK